MKVNKKLQVYRKLGQQCEEIEEISIRIDQ